MPIDSKEIQRLVDEHGLTACFECGKCTATCPIAKTFGKDDFECTPRSIIEMALLDSDLVTGDAIWYCLTCDVCTKGCPCDVRFRDFIEDLREIAMEVGHDEHGIRCASCNRYFMPDTALKLIVSRITAKQQEEALDHLHTCPRCRPREFSRKLMRNLAPPSTRT